jgi:hypothetical protein
MGSSRTEVVVVDPIEKFANTLGLQSDATCLRGKFLVQTITTTTTPVAALILNPGNFGVRAANLNAIFAYYRFKRLVMKYNYTSSATAAGTVGVMGILDDASGAEGDAPTSANGLLEFRTSASNYNIQQPTVVEYKPPSPQWMRTYVGSSGSDQRLVNTGSLIVCSALGVSSTHVIEIDYSVVFKGALDTGSSITLPLSTDGEKDYVDIAPPPPVFPVSIQDGKSIRSRTSLPVR